MRCLMKKFIILITVILSTVLIAIPANAADKTVKQAEEKTEVNIEEKSTVKTEEEIEEEKDVKKKNPITINADKMQYLQKENCMIAENNVVVALDDQSLMADKVVAFQGVNADGKQDFTRIVATGDVVIKTPERSLYGKKAVWERNENIIRFTGNPVVKIKGGQQISAEVIKFNVITSKVTFEGVANAKMSLSDENNFDFSGF